MPTYQRNRPTVCISTTPACFLKIAIAIALTATAANAQAPIVRQAPQAPVPVMQQSLQQPAIAQPKTYGSGRYFDVHMTLDKGRTRDARINVFSNGTEDQLTTCARIMGVDLRCYTAKRTADGKWDADLPRANELVDTYLQADAAMAKVAVKALMQDLAVNDTDWTAKDAAPVPANGPQEYLGPINVPVVPTPPLEPRRVRVFVSCSGLYGNNWQVCYLKNYVAKKYALIDGKPAATGEAIKRNGSYVAQVQPSGDWYTVSAHIGRSDVDYPIQTCKSKTLAGCAKEAYEFLDAIIQNDNTSPTSERPLVVTHADGTATVYYQSSAINVSSKANIRSAICEVKKDDPRCTDAHAAPAQAAILPQDQVVVTHNSNGPRPTVTVSYQGHTIEMDARNEVMAICQVTKNADPRCNPQPTPGVLGQSGVYHIGGDITPPSWLNKVEPVYSADGQQAKVNGNVLVYMIVDATGHGRNFKVLRGLGHGLDEKAVEAMQASTFHPATKDGVPVPVELQVEVNFQNF